jgi:hypothetical protein
VHRVVEDDLLVDLVGEDHQIVPAGYVDQAADRGVRVDRAGRVVRVDDHEPVGVLGDLGLDVGQVRVPAVVLVAEIVHRGAAGQGHGAGPQRIVRGRDQDLVAVVDEGLEHHGDQLRDPVADEDVADPGLGQAARLVVLGYRGPRRIEPAGIAVPLGVRQVMHHVGDDRLRRVEAEQGQIADIELEHPVALGLQPLRLGQDRAADVVADTAQFAALDDRAHDGILAFRRVLL